MITKVQLKNFKKFKSSEFELKPQGLTLLAGGNNSGKSTLLHALAVWEFCREVWEQERGVEKLYVGATAKKVILTLDEFYPVNVPALDHLWYDVRPSPTGKDLSIGVEWSWTPPTAAGAAALAPEPHKLVFSLSYHHDRVHVHLTETTLRAGAKIPSIAYLPSFAGMQKREPSMTPAERARLVGAGMPGATLRNVLRDLYATNQTDFARLQDNQPITAARRNEFIEGDGWEQLQKVINEVFGALSDKILIRVDPFKPLIHTALSVATRRAYLKAGKLKPVANVPPKDIMVEGSGFLQWLSVYALLVNPAINVVLLDEPDAHLHALLQGNLVDRLQQHSARYEKQVLVATHSTTVLSHAKVTSILRVEESSYLADDRGRIRLFEGIGSVYSPLLDQLKLHKKVLFYEGPSDYALFAIWARTLKVAWPPPNVVLRESTRKDREERAMIFGEFKKEIANLQGLSLQDRDDYAPSDVTRNLTFDGLPKFKSGFGLRKWRRRNIESYLLCTRAIAQASNKSEPEVTAVLALNGVALPPNATAWDCPDALLLCDGKKVILHPDNPNSVLAQLGCTYMQIAEAMRADEIPDDVKEFFDQVVQFTR